MTPFIAKLILVIGAVSLVRHPAAASEALVEDPDPHQPAHHAREAAADLLLHRAWDHSFSVCGIRVSRASPIIRSSRCWPGLAPLRIRGVALAVLSGSQGTRPQLVRFAGGARAAQARYRWSVPLCPPPHVHGVFHVGVGAGAVVAELDRGTGRAGRIWDAVPASGWAARRQMMLEILRRGISGLYGAHGATYPGYLLGDVAWHHGNTIECSR